MNVIGLIAAGSASAVATGLLTWPLARLLAGYGLVDRPNERSLHERAIPRGGGAALVLVTTLALLIAIAIGLDSRLWLLLALSLGLGAVGFADDRSNLGAEVRLAAQVVVAVTMIVLVRDPELGRGQTWPLLVTCVVTAAWAIGACNAVNFMDGVDGISALHFIVFGFHLAIVGWADELVVVPAVLLVGAAVGFGYWNVVRRIVFLGDGGAYFVGSYLAAVTALAAIRTSAPLIAAAPFAVYAADTSLALARRVTRREHLAQAHQSHVYQQLVLARSASHLTSAVFTATASALCSIAAILVDRAVIAGPLGFAAVAVIVAVYLTSPRWFPASADALRPPVAPPCT